jgi:hypothetical protein
MLYRCIGEWRQNFQIFNFGSQFNFNRKLHDPTVLFPENEKLYRGVGGTDAILQGLSWKIFGFSDAKKFPAFTESEF